MSSDRLLEFWQEKAINLAGLPLHPVGVGDVHSVIENIVESGQKTLILNLNIHAANFGFKLPWFQDLLKKAGVVFCDGDGIRWACRILNQPVPDKITYDRWMWLLADFCQKKNISLYFLGSKPGISEEAAKRLKQAFPQVKILGSKDGYFNKTGPENEAILADINQKQPDILVIGFGMPLQEEWLRDNWQKINAHIFLNGGAVFDCVSGKLKRPPEWVVKLQLEWFFRFCQQPVYRFKRYFIGIPYFFMKILRFKFLGK